MKVWIVEIEEDDGYTYVSKVCSSFEKAKDSIRQEVIETIANWYCCVIPEKDKKEIKEILDTFEKEGYIDEFLYIKEYEVD